MTRIMMMTTMTTLRLQAVYNSRRSKGERERERETGGVLCCVVLCLVEALLSQAGRAAACLEIGRMTSPELRCIDE